MKFLLHALLLLLLTQTTMQAQKLEQFIPKDAAMVMKVDAERIAGKVDLGKLKQIDIFESFLDGVRDEVDRETGEVIKKALQSPSEYGMNLNKPYYMYAQSDEKNTKVGFLMQLSDKSKFEKLLEQQMGAFESARFVEQKAYNSWFVDGSGISWTDDVAQVVGVFIERDTIEHEDDVVYQQAKTNFLENAVAEGYGYSMAQSILAHSNYKLSSKSVHDVSIWMDYEFINSMSDDSGTESLDMLGMGGFADQLNSLYDDSYLLVGADFEDGKMDIDSKMFMNDAMAKMYRESSGGAFNKRFARYIPKENLLGFMSFNLNIDGMVGAMKSFFDPNNEMMPFMEGMAFGALKGMGVDLDADEVYKLFPGDMIMAVTGMKSFTGKMIVNEYDEDFNMIEMEKETTQELPLMTMMMSYSNEEHLKKLLSLAESMLGFQWEDGYMKMAVPDAPMDMYMAFEKGILFVSNDEILIKKKRKRGYCRRKRMSKKQCKMLMEKASVMFWDIPKTMDVVKSLESPMPGADGFLRSTKETFSNFTMTMDNVTGNVFTSKMSLNFEDKNKNSMTQFLNYINEMYLTSGQSL